jgi:CRISPR-associated endoribonuclease Cas6
MRFSLTLQIDEKSNGNLLPLSYSYELSSWIYKVLASSNSDYATWLHENGFSIEGKRFKFFVFSHLFFEAAKPLEGTDRLTIFSDRAKMLISFLPPKSTEEFIKGIFLNREFTLGDHKSRIKMKVIGVEALVPPVFPSGEIRCRTLSPINVSLKDDNGKICYISPNDDDYNYGSLLINNLKEKYRIYNNHPFTGKADFEFRLLSRVRSKLIKIKSDTPEETRIRGFLFDFYLKADPELLNLMYESGAGEKNSLGFGMVEILKE